MHTNEDKLFAPIRGSLLFRSSEILFNSDKVPQDIFEG